MLSPLSNDFAAIRSFFARFYAASAPWRAKTPRHSTPTKRAETAGTDCAAVACGRKRIPDVRSADTALSQLSAYEALREVEKLAIYEIEAVVYGLGGVLIDLDDLHRLVGRSPTV